MSRTTGSLAVTCATAGSEGELVGSVLLSVRDAVGADSCALLRRVAQGDQIIGEAGTASPSARHVIRHPLPVSATVLDVTFGTAPEQDVIDWLATVAVIVDGGLSRLAAEEALGDLRARVDNAQQLAQMGDYDWHIASDTNTWSDQLYRIYGHEPKAFNASYERFLSFIHPDDRERIQQIHQEAYATGEPYEMVERIIRADGELRYLASNGQVVMDEEGTPVRMRGTCIDITARVLAERESEALVAGMREAQVRRRQALEINDNVVQGLAAAVYAMEEDHTGAAGIYLERTLASARRMMHDLLEPLEGEDLQPGDLVRSHASSDVPAVGRQRQPRSRSGAAVPGQRVLVVDDSADMRVLICALLDRVDGLTVVGEARNGEEAVALAADLQPDLIVLDLAMPVMDGLQCLPLLREVVADCVVVVLSGFDETMMADKAMQAGADRYVEKGRAFEDLVGTIRAALDDREGSPSRR